LELATTTNTTNTSIVLTDATSLPSEGDFNISIESEIMLVTHRTANTLTVVRGTDGTSGASHTGGQAAQVIATKTGVDKVMCDAGLLCAATPNRLSVTAASFSWINQGTSSLGGQPLGWGHNVDSERRPSLFEMCVHLGSLRALDSHKPYSHGP